MRVEFLKILYKKGLKQKVEGLLNKYFDFIFQLALQKYLMPHPL